MKYIDEKAVMEIVREAGSLFGDRASADHIQIKGEADFVTQVDLEVQNYIQKKLYELYPEIQFMGEEKGNDDIDKNGLLWILDPVDGTTNLIRDYKCSAVSLALFENRKPVLGIVYDPYLKEMYFAKAGEGCWLNGKKVSVSSVQALSQSLVAIGTSPYYKELAEENFEVFKNLFKNSLDVRRSGSAAIDLAHVACGRIDCYLERNLKIWDYAAGMLLVREAGGVVWNYEGLDVTDTYMGDILAGNLQIATVVQQQYL
jgi:myo-inositol-1(or 4)-monophosphatase